MGAAVTRMELGNHLNTPYPVSSKGQSWLPLITTAAYRRLWAVAEKTETLLAPIEYNTTESSQGPDSLPPTERVGEAAAPTMGEGARRRAAIGGRTESWRLKPPV